MRTLLTPAVVCLVIVAGAATLAAPQQYPGQMTQARVWVQNHETSEAIPVDIRQATLDRPLRVSLLSDGAPAGASNPLPVRLVRSTWEYRTIVIANADEMPRSLADAGAEGWETTGTTWSGPQGTRLLLKRPR